MEKYSSLISYTKLTLTGSVQSCCILESFKKITWAQIEIYYDFFFMTYE